MVDLDRQDTYNINASIREEEEQQAEKNLRRRLVQGSSEEYSNTDGPPKNAKTDVNDVKLELDSSGEENQSLINNKKVYQPKLPVCYKFKRWMGWIVSLEKREIHLNGTITPNSFPTNR